MRGQSKISKRISEVLERWNQKDLIAYLKAELDRREFTHVWVESGRTPESDSEETPKEVIKWIAKLLHIKKNQLYDVCPLKENWKAGEDFDALCDSWPGDVNWCNPAFSKAQLFLIKALTEFIKGKSCVVLLPQQCTMTPVAKTLIEQVAEVKYPGPITFGKHKTPLNLHLTMIFLIRPEFIDQMPIKTEREKQALDAYQMETRASQNNMRFPVMTKEEIAYRLFDQRAFNISVANICEVSMRNVTEMYKRWKGRK